jgi:hypothetical protein
LSELLEMDVGFECLEVMSLWCRQVNWGNCEITWVNCAVLCERLLERQFWGLHYCLSKLCSLVSFSIRCDVTK